MKLHRVSDRIYANWDGETGGNVGIIELDDKVLVVDAQYPGSAKKFREAISEISDKPLSHLILTHIHGDHVFGNQVFEGASLIEMMTFKSRYDDTLVC